jgi:hypothetical protein
MGAQIIGASIFRAHCDAYARSTSCIVVSRNYDGCLKLLARLSINSRATL